MNNKTQPSKAYNNTKYVVEIYATNNKIGDVRNNKK